MTKAKAKPAKKAAPKQSPRAKSLGAKQSRSDLTVIRAALSSGQPGQWTSDHRAESEKFTGSDYIAIHAIAMQAAQATVKVYDDSRPGRTRKTLRKSYGADDETRCLPETHPLVKLLSRPSPKQSGALFRYECLLQWRLTGTILIWNVPNCRGTTCERYVIPTGVALPQPPTHDMPRGGWYVQPALASRWAAARDPEGYVENRGFSACIGKTIPAEQVQVIRMPHPLWKDDGQSPVAAGALWKDSADQIDLARWGQLHNGADGSLVFALDKEVLPTPEELDRIKAKLKEQYGGAKKAGAIIVVTGGVTVTPVSTTPKDMAYDVGFTQLRDATLAIHGVPGMAAGIVSATGREGLYAPLLQFTMLTVQPLLSILAEEDTINLAPQFGSNLTVELEAASIDDPDLLDQEIKTDVDAGAILVDELRALRGRPPLPNGDGQVIAGQAAQISQGNAFGGSQGQDSGGEFGDLGRRQWTNNRKAINDVLSEVSEGDMEPGLGIELLVMMGVNQERAERLVEGAAPQSQPADLGSGFEKSLRRLLKKLKQRLKVHGLTLVIEHPKGSVRTGSGPDGDWSRRMKAHYGYIARTESEADGDPIDVFIGPKPDAELVFVMDQVDQAGNFDEHKVLVGWLAADDAEAGYLANYPEGWKAGELTAMTIPQFKAWLNDGDTSIPAAAYRGATAKSLNGHSRINGNGKWLAEAVGHLGDR